MDTSATQHQQPVDAGALAGQQVHWAATFAANPDMYGTDPSVPGLAAAEAFAAAGHGSVLELGAGQGRDTLYLARRGLHVTALDYAAATVETLCAKAHAAGLDDMVSAARHDIRQPLPLPDASIDASCSHMLFSMALTTSELVRLAGELRRVLRPGGLVVYTARTTADAHYGTGTPRGDEMYEHGGFIVHFFDRALIDHFAVGYELIDVTDFTEGDLPRRLARVTMRVPQRTIGQGAPAAMGPPMLCQAPARRCDTVRSRSSRLIALPTMWVSITAPTRTPLVMATSCRVASGDPTWASTCSPSWSPGSDSGDKSCLTASGAAAGEPS